MGCNECEKFSIIGENAEVSLNKPIPSGEEDSLTKDVERFDLWDNDYEVVDKGINDDSLNLTGVETICDDESGICFPICFPICPKDVIISKFVSISNMMKYHEEVEISGLGDNIDGIYIISNFNYKSTRSSLVYEWRMSLDFVRWS